MNTGMDTTAIDNAAWRRLDRETSSGYRAFARYLAMGPTRSLARLHQEIRTPLPTIKRWSSRWSWQARCKAFDSAAVQAGLDRRAIQLALGRQQAVDLIPENLGALQSLARGDEPEGGSREVILDRHRNPVYSEYTDPETGATTKELVTRPAISAAVRVKAILGLLELAGLSPKAGADLDAQARDLQRQLRERLRKLPPAVVEPLGVILELADRVGLEAVCKGVPIETAVGLNAPDAVAVNEIESQAAALQAAFDSGRDRPIGEAFERATWLLLDCLAIVDPAARARQSLDEYRRPDHCDPWPAPPELTDGTDGTDGDGDGDAEPATE